VASQLIKVPAALQQPRAGVASFSPVIHVRSNAVRMAVTPDNRLFAGRPLLVRRLKQAYEYSSYQKTDRQGSDDRHRMSNDFPDSVMAAYSGH
jgi:hypothetical protein